MPRKPIEIKNKIESLSVLGPDGQLDTDLEPKISDADLRRLYKTMRASRALDDRCLKLQRQGRMGTYAPSTGQEAASLGAAYCMQQQDWMVPSFRETAAMLWRGWSMAKAFFYWGGYEFGAVPPPNVNDTPICIPVGSQCAYAPGLAWGLKLKGSDGVCVAFVGDGATSEGDFHEGLNFAGVYQVPLVMVVQNNHWAISLPRDKQTASETFAQKAMAYGFDAIQVDGNDILGMIVATQEAVAKGRSGGGPTLIEAVTYRLGVHTSADDPRKYRSEEEVCEWEKRDPVIRFQNYLISKDLLSPKAEQIIEEEIKRELDEATRVYESYEIDPYAFFRYVYADLTPDLKRQMGELRDYFGDGPALAEPSAQPKNKRKDYSRSL